MLFYALSVVLAYLLGSIPFGLLIARVKHVDIRAVGSGNIGATNVFRTVSKPLGLVTFALDYIKGLLPVWLFPVLLERVTGQADPWSLLAIACGLSAILGHNWPIYVQFKGGKGVSTSTGVLTGLLPPAIAIGLVVWLLVVALSGYVSVASILAGVGAMVYGWVAYGNGTATLPVAILLTILAILVIVRHRINLVRLARGEEYHFPALFNRTPSTSDK